MNTQIDLSEVTELLLGEWGDTRLATRQKLRNSDFWRLEGLTVDAHRERVFNQLQLIADSGIAARSFPKEYGGQDDCGANLSGSQELGLADPSLAIKAGVQWGLFGSAVYLLGTKQHWDAWLRDIISLKLPGAFAMTETGHGSDVASIATTATYLPESEEFVIHTPFRGAWKDFIGNAAVHGRAAVVFAQLITEGVNYGVHAFFVPLRDESGEFLPGIDGVDDGIKGGLNGVDNGRLHFDGVTVPRFNLLNRYGSVAADGTYSSDISSPGRRFFTMLGSLVQGRVTLDGAVTLASALAINIAVTYGNQRRQFDSGNAGGETLLLDYGKHQQRLIPRIAQVYAQFFANHDLMQHYVEVFSGRDDTPASRERLETLAAALKPLSSWNALDTLQECREACGGAGYLAENRLVSLRQDFDIFVTFEGDNNILLQLVGKRLLTDFGAKFKGKNPVALGGKIAFESMARLARNLGSEKLRRGALQAGQSGESLTEKQQHTLLRGRVDEMTARLGGQLRPTSRLPRDKASELINRHQVELIDTARAYGELLQWESFSAGIKRATDADTREVLKMLRDLFGLSLIDANLGWYLAHNRLSRGFARSLQMNIQELSRLLRKHSQDLVDAFGFAPDDVRAPIASGEERDRQNEARSYFEDLEARGAGPVPERVALTSSSPE